MKWWALEKKEVLEFLKTDPNKGLSEEEAKIRLEKYGENVIKKEKRKSPIKIFLSQFTSPLVLLLLIASIISMFFGDVTDTILIFLIVVINSLLGFYQEYKAERAVEELAKLTSPKIVVIREGKRRVIDSRFLVPGDIVLLRQGDIVPADIRIIREEGLEVDESIITGESKPVEKEDIVLEEDTPIYKRKNMLFMGSYVVRGECLGVVVETGKRTEIGKIAKKLETIEEKKTPTMVEIERLAKFLTYLTASLIFIMFITGLTLKISDLKTIILVAISLGVAAIPEGLPVVITIALALGAQRMLKKRVLVRKLRAIQDLGAVDVICTDKTGTLTEGRMIPRVIWTWDKYILAETISVLEPNVEKIMEISLLCHDLKEVDGKLIGDELETSLYTFGYRFKDVLPEKRIIKKIPFDPKRKMMSVITEDNTILTKGAPERVLERCRYIEIDGKIEELDEKKKEKILKEYRKLASEGYYVIGFAYGIGDKEENLVFLGLLGLFDRIRDRVKEAISDCKTAGIRVIMITGDNKYTALKVAKEIGIEEENVLEGEEISKLSDEELRKVVEEVSVFARVSPEDKYRILVALQKNGHFVAMTGDGVNDALALKKADVGIAMGIRGAEVSKQVADVIILDDNFATIVDGIKEGRGIMENVYKFVNYLLSANIMEVIVVFLSSLIKKVILGPVHLLWINLATDGPLATALSVDEVPEDIMKKPPRQRIVDEKMVRFIVYVGLINSAIILSLLLFGMGRWGFQEMVTITFTTMIFAEFSRVFVVRKISGNKAFSNKYLNISLIILVFLQILMVYSPLSKFFKITSLNLEDWAIISIGTVTSYISSLWIGKKIYSR